MVENKIFIGNGNEIALILSDEMLHVDWTSYLINTIVKDDPRFAQVAAETKKESLDMLHSVIDEEKSWAKYLFKEGSVIGLNERTMVNFVDWTAQYRLKDIGLKYDAGIKSTPVPWFNKHLNTNKKQTALQENESVAYILSSMTNSASSRILAAVPLSASCFAAPYTSAGIEAAGESAGVYRLPGAR